MQKTWKVYLVGVPSMLKSTQYKTNLTFAVMLI